MASRCWCWALPTAVTSRRTPSARPSGCATSCWRPVPVSSGTIRTSTPTTFAASGSSRTSSDPGNRCVSPCSRRRTTSTANWTRRACRAWSCSSTVATRWTVNGSIAQAWGMSESVADGPIGPPSVGMAAGRGVWVVLPTYNERENLEPIAAAILSALPEASLLVVDDRSPDGTGELADTIAARERRVSVLHRPLKEGLGVAYRDGFRWVLERPETRAVVQMDADFSHDPATLPRMLAPLMGNADLVLGTRYMPGGSTVGWPWYRKLISRGGTVFARTVLMLPYRDLTGGFKAWRRELIDAIRLRETSGSGYGFQIETTWWAHRRGATIVQVPIVFRERVVGTSKMSGGIVREAMLLVLRLRWGAIRDAIARS